MVIEEPSDVLVGEAGDVEPQHGALPWWRRLSVHAAALGFILLALIPLFDSTAPIFADEGLYSAQAAALADGSWSASQPAAELDDDGSATAMVGPSVSTREWVIPYSRRPAYPLLLTPLFALAGSAGLLFTSVLGTWVAAVCGAALARRLDRRYALPTLWLIGVGSPLLFSAFIVMGHAIAAGLAGIMLVGVAAVIDDRSNRWIAPTALAAAGLVLVRSEGTIMVLATCLTLVALSIRWKSPGLDRRPLGMGLGLAVVGAGAFIVNDLAAKAVSSDLISKTGSVVDERAPLNAAWVNLFRPWFGSGSSATITASFITLAVVLAALSLRLLPRLVLLPLVLLCGAAATAVARQFEPLLLVSGLLPAFPVLAAVLLLTRRDLARPGVARLALISVATTIGLVLTVYGELEGSQWGGRFFQILLPALGPLVILGLDRGRAVLTTRQTMVAGAALVVMTLSISLFSLRLNLDNRRMAEALVTGTFEFADELGLEDPVVAVAEIQPTGTGRLFWRPWTDGAKVIQPNLDQLRETLLTARELGRDQILIVSDADRASFEMILGGALADSGWDISDARAVSDLYSVIVITDVGR